MPFSTACGGASSIDVMAWGPGQGLLAAAAPDGATSLLSETVLHRLLRADVGVIQLSTDTVRVERQNGASVLLTTDLSIRGLAVSSRHAGTSVGLASVFHMYRTHSPTEDLHIYFLGCCVERTGGSSL
jgi:hypothetical protein|tara:strand:+ start:218 stop:601 length:384 start_codon:yes stop_codon:yes gene_type:complete